VRVCKRHASIVCTFEQPLLNGHVVERGGVGPVDMELWRFERRYQRELLGVQIGVDGWIGVDAWLGINANPNPNTFKPGRSCIFRRF